MKRQAFVFVILALASGYVFADAYDFVPGFLTVREPEPVASPYPELNPVEQEGQSELALASFADAPMPKAAQVQKALDGFLADNDHLKGHVSALVVDAITGETLGEIDPDTPRTPASNMKVTTALAALDVLGGDTAFSTITALDGNTVYLIGGGDVLLGMEDPDPNAAYGHSSIPQLAEATAKALKDKGVTSISLRVDSTLFAEPLYHEGVEPANRQYVMQARPLGTKEAANTELFGEDPDLRVAQLLTEKLREQGIEVDSVERTSTPSPESAIELARVESASVRQLVDYMLTNSDNSTAETLAHLVAVKSGKPASFAGGADAVRNTLDSLGVQTDDLIFADGSGLSNDNRLTARALVEIADLVWHDGGEKYGALAAGLPVGGYNGTLNSRFMEDGMGGLVHAKTGSLSKVVSLSGYLQTKQGRLLEFAVIVDDIPDKRVNPETEEEEPVPAVKPAMDKTLVAIANL
ncbi:MAG: D-alanyl-D-alanine carboxypeptidase/D-alanyl-D-alanine-endopeptidase [Actinomycetaceae bacterium]|nr:D-alanyl-D-alanine carboxypeptidase/D-alanyl-D-alanine-endopeptidase [Actinomycetaceae bacterium]